MEKFLLGGFLSYNKLDIVDQQHVDIPVFFTELGHGRIVAVSDGLDQFVGKLLTGGVHNPAGGVFLQNKVGDGVHQMGFSQSHASVEEQRL